MNKPKHLYRFQQQAGVSLVEMMVAMTIGLALAIGLTSVYISTKGAFRRQNQLSQIQQTVRTAFDFIADDARGAGNFGCYTGNAVAPNQQGIAANTLAGNFSLTVSGYEYANATPGSLTLTTGDTANVAKWSNNTGADPLSIQPTIIGDATNGIRAGSDVLVLRTSSGLPARLAVPTAAGNTLSIQDATKSSKCADGSDKTAGFCPGTYGVIANCASAKIFSAGTISSAGSTTTITLPSSAPFTANEFDVAKTEVFPIQSVVYYLRTSSTGAGSSLYRRVFDGEVAGGTEQELLDNVENMQVLFGLDNAPSGALDGAVDVYKTADQILPAEWPHVVAIRVGLLVRASDPVGADVALPSSGKVNDVTVTYPDTNYDRRVFTTTITLRNKAAAF